MLTKQDWDEAAKRLLNVIDNNTTELDDCTYEVPVSYFFDEGRWKREIEVIFKKQPLALALSCELAEPNSYKAMSRVDVPFLLTRGEDRKVRGFINKCRHRGALITGDAEKCGVAKRFSCPYHAWTFDNKGMLIGIPERDKFGHIPADYRHLIEINVEERAGLIWGVLTPGVGMNLEEHLGAMLPMLEKLGLDKFHLAGTSTMTGSNWKLVNDGNIEHYHFRHLHKNSVGNLLLSEFTIYDKEGFHTRFFVPGAQIGQLRDIPEAEWKASNYVFYAFSLFPNSGLGLTPTEDLQSQIIVLNLVWPGSAPNKSITQQVFATPRPMTSEKDKDTIKQHIEWQKAFVEREDIPVVNSQQNGLASMANQKFIYGGLERITQHFERGVNALVEASYAKNSPAAE